MIFAYIEEPIEKKQDLCFLWGRITQNMYQTLLLETLRFWILLLWGFTWLNDVQRVSLPSWLLLNPEHAFWAMPATKMVNGRCEISFSACLLSLGTPPNCLFYTEFRKEMSVCCFWDQSVSGLSSYLIQKYLLYLVIYIFCSLAFSKNTRKLLM